MKESMPSIVHPPHAAQKLRTWLRVSGGLVRGAFSETLRTRIFLPGGWLGGGASSTRFCPNRIVNIRGPSPNEERIFLGNTSLSPAAVVDMAQVSCIPLAACRLRSL